MPLMLFKVRSVYMNRFTPKAVTPCMSWDQISDKKNKEEHWIEDISLKEAMNRLETRERNIIEMRFYEGKTQMEVAQEIGISQAQVSRLEKHALKSMKNYLRS